MGHPCSSQMPIQQEACIASRVKTQVQALLTTANPLKLNSTTPFPNSLSCCIFACITDPHQIDTLFCLSFHPHTHTYTHVLRDTTLCVCVSGSILNVQSQAYSRSFLNFERQTASHPLVHSSHGHSSWAWEARNSIQAETRLLEPSAFKGRH